MVNKTENPYSIYAVLEQWLDDVTKNNDKFLLAARSYTDSVAGLDTVREGVNPQGQSERSSRQTTSSLYSQRKHEFFVEKLKREEAEKQEQAAMRLVKQKKRNCHEKKEPEIQMGQMALQELEKDNRQRVAADKLDEAELIDNRSLFSHHSSELNMLRDRGSDRSEKLDHDWVNLFAPGNLWTAENELNFSFVLFQQPLTLLFKQPLFCPASATADPTIQYTAPGNPPENPSNVAGILNHLEMLSQYTRLGIALSIAEELRFLSILLWHYRTPKFLSLVFP